MKELIHFSKLSISNELTSVSLSKAKLELQLEINNKESLEMDQTNLEKNIKKLNK